MRHKAIAVQVDRVTPVVTSMKSQPRSETEFLGFAVFWQRAAMHSKINMHVCILVSARLRKKVKRICKRSDQHEPFFTYTDSKGNQDRLDKRSRNAAEMEDFV